jgi:hypothetical protein
VTIRKVTEKDAEQVIELLSLAFFDDPTWSWAFADPDTRMEDYRAWWGCSSAARSRTGGRG